MHKTAKNLGTLPLAVAVSAFTAFGFAPTASLAATVDITPASMGTWAFDHRNSSGVQDSSANGIGQMVTGPAAPPIGTGSAQLATGDGTNNGDGPQELRSTGFAGTRLDSITTLSYSTYDTVNNGQQFPYLELLISFTGGPGAGVDDALFFEAPYQQNGTGNSSLPFQADPTLNTWQTWNALEGGWWSNNGEAGCNPGTDVCALSTYLAAHPDASIVNGTLGGVNFAVGYASPTDQFNGYVDNFTLNGTTYNFDPASATPLPGALPLFASGLGAFGLLGWRRKRKKVAAA